MNAVGVAQHEFNADSYTNAVDNWAVGCVFWELLVGTPPFLASEEEILFYKITDNQVEIPAHVSADAADLIRQLMHSEPAQRLTSERALAHPWLADEVARMELLQTVNPPPRESRRESQSARDSARESARASRG